METQDYVDLITSEHQDKAKFIEMIRQDVSLPVRVQALLNDMIPKFDVDAAVGDQLDTIGQWVGVSRNVGISIPGTGIFFSWDGIASLGWDYGTWQEGDQTEITSLPDDAYRTLIKTKIAANSWDGTTEGAYAIWDQIFTQFTILIQDNQDMSYDLIIAGGIVDSLTLALLTGGYIPLKPEGVRVNEYYTPVDSGPIFGWDIDGTYLTGWDDGKWAYESSPD
jgi:hypothetical protein